MGTVLKGILGGVCAFFPGGPGYGFTDISSWEKGCFSCCSSSLFLVPSMIIVLFAIVLLWDKWLLEQGLRRAGTLPFRIRRLLSALGGLCRAFLPLLIFMGAGFGWMQFTQEEAFRSFYTIVLCPLASLEIFRLCAMLVLSPRVPRARLFRAEESSIQSLWRFLRGFLWILCGGIVVPYGAQCFFDVSETDTRNIEYGFFLLIGIYGGIALFQAHAPIKKFLNGPYQGDHKNAWMEAFCALNEGWGFFFVGSLLFGFIPSFCSEVRIFSSFFYPLALSLGAIAGTQILITLLLRGLCALRRGIVAGKAQNADFLEKANKYVTQGESFLIAACYALLLCIISHFFELSVFRAAHTPFGRTIFSGFFESVALICVGIVLYQGSTLYIDCKISITQMQNPEKEKRLRTFLPLLRSLIHIIILLLVVCGVVENLGFSITPLIASLSVFGLAVSFGAQEVTKSFIQGAIVLIEDDMDAGDYVTINGVSGFVERMSIRAVYVREITGTLHTIPYSTVGAFCNLSRDYTFQIYELTMDPREQVSHVVQALEEVGQELLAEEYYRRQIIEPVQVLGVTPFDGKGVTVLWTIKTHPDPIKLIGFEFYRRLKQRFDAMGLNIPIDLHKIYAAGDQLFAQARHG